MNAVTHNNDLIKNGQNSDEIQLLIKLVDDYLKRRNTGKSKLFFKYNPEGWGHYSFNKLIKMPDEVFNKIMKEDSRNYNIDLNTREGRVYLLLYLSDTYPTASMYNKYQCRPGASRSAQDIYRIYINYFKEDHNVETIDIMRALYNLSKNNRIGGQFCRVVRKMVFWPDQGMIYDYEISEFGFGFKFWGDLFRKGVEYK